MCRKSNCDFIHWYLRIHIEPDLIKAMTCANFSVWGWVVLSWMFGLGMYFNQVVFFVNEVAKSWWNNFYEKV